MSTKCTNINHPNIQGWGCCQCRTFNGIIDLAGNMRTNCKQCRHARCDEVLSSDEEDNLSSNWEIN